MPIEVKSICDSINPQGILDKKYKICTKCKQEKSLEEFYKDKTTKNGYHHVCKRCKKLYTLSGGQTYEKYKITSEEVKNIFEGQNGICPICKEPLEIVYGIDSKENKNKNRACVDHISGTLDIRGLLHANCNAGIGFLNHDVNRLLAAIEYLQKPIVFSGNRSYKRLLRKNNSTAYRGVTKYNTKYGFTYQARLKFNYKNFNLGTFSFPEEAARAYDNKLLELCPDIDLKYLNNIPSDWNKTIIISNLEF